MSGIFQEDRTKSPSAKGGHFEILSILLGAWEKDIYKYIYIFFLEKKKWLFSSCSKFVTDKNSDRTAWKFCICFNNKSIIFKCELTIYYKGRKKENLLIFNMS